MKKSPKGKGGSKSKETPIEETTPKEINDIIRLSVHSLNAGKVIEFPFDVKIKLMFAGELVVTVIVLNMSTSTVASKKGSEKSKGTAASKGKIKNGEVLLGSATLDIFPILLGNAEIKFRLLLEKDEFVEGSHVISWPNLPSLCVSAAVVGDILMKDEARPFNVLYITLESLYNFPASVTNLSVALMFPLFENENYETIRFEDCQFKETPYGDQKKRWATLSKITGRSALSSYMLSDNSVEILNEAKVDKQLLNNLSNYPRLEWNAIHRCWMLQSSQEMIIERLTKYRCWPLELYINEDVGKISKTKEKNVKDANITMSKVHFVAYLNLTKLLYPGVEEVHVTSQLYTYVKKDMITTSGQEKSVFDTSEPVPDETPATATAPVAAKPPKPSKVPTKKKPKSDVEEKIEDEISLPIFTEDGEPVFVTVQVQVMKPFFQKRTPDYLENSILELIPKRPEPNTALVNSEKAVKDLTDCLEILSSLLDRNYQEFSKTYNCQNQENIKKDFVAYIEDSGIGTTIMNTLRDKVVNYIKFKIGLPQKIEYHLPFQNFLCDTYTKIVEHMYKTVNSLTDGHLTAERASLDPLPLQVKTTDLYYFALEALEEGFFKRAKIYLLKRLNFDKGNSGFWLDLAIFMLGNGDVSSSIEYVKEVIILETRDKLG
ncbi:cilia- and flagella-associated protein 70-like [Lycorma delicatula]|uniref:cilia- and flagella-associated protein 70-like n=1 Tax=Lycorma delicatula TaxID=130591 RepID=UPI003F518866